MLQLFEFDEDLNETTTCNSTTISLNNCWSTRKTKLQSSSSYSSLPEDVWVEIFSFFPTNEKLLSLILVSKHLQAPIYKSIKSLKLLGIDKAVHSTSHTNNNNIHTVHNNNTRVAYSEEDKWLMSPISFSSSSNTQQPSTTSPQPPAVEASVVNRNLSYASRMSTKRRLSKLTQGLNSSHSSSVPSLSELCNQTKQSSNETNPLIKLLTPFSKINELSLEFCKALDGETLMTILEKFTHLQSLTIIHCSSLFNINITYPMEVCRNLRRLEIRDCRSIQECAGGLKIDCHLLEHLSITSTPCANERFLSHLIDRNCHTLKSLNLFSLQDFASISISKKMDCLEKLSLQRCKNFSKFHLPIKQVCTVFPSLTELDLSHTSISDDSIRSLTCEQKLEGLQLLKIENCKNLIKPTFGLCPKLSNMSLDFCSALEDVVIPPNNCPSLHTLSLNYTRISDKSIERIFTIPQPVGFINNELKTPPITKLSAKKCKSIFNPKITSFNLEDLDLHGCYNISSVKVVDLSKKSLKRINLGWTKIDDENLTKLVETCPSITELSVNTCDNLINPTIQSESLQYISFQGAHHLQSPVLKCDSLKQVDLRNCDNLESPTLVKRKKKKVNHQQAIYQVRRRLDFDQYVVESTAATETEVSTTSSPSTMINNDAPDFNTPMPSTPISQHKTFEVQQTLLEDDNNGCESSPIFHPKMKVIEEENQDEDFVY